jgi:hypothetical protein
MVSESGMLQVFLGFHGGKIIFTHGKNHGNR